MDMKIRYTWNMFRRAFKGAMLGFIIVSSANADQNAQSVSLELTGSIEPRCELSNLSSAEANFAIEDAQIIRFDIYCNLEMSIGLSARNGALTNEAAVGRNGFDSVYVRQYTAFLALQAFDFKRQIEGSELVGGISYDVTDGVVYQTSGSLQIQLDEPLADGYAGEYVDEIRITVTPSLAIDAFN